MDKTDDAVMLIDAKTRLAKANGGHLRTLDAKMAALALHRFGLGPRAGSIAAIAADPRGALLAEIDRPGAGRIDDPDLLPSGEAARAVFDFRQERKAARLAERAEKEGESAREAERRRT